MPAAWSVILILAALIGVGEMSRRVVANPRRDVIWGIAHLLARTYARLVHRVRVVGAEHIPQSPEPGPLIIVVNHTAGVDPILVQALCPFDIRWMMAADMQVEFLNWAWEWLRVISVDRLGRDTISAREAVRHLQGDGVIGIFPEGAIERPARQIMPFYPGVGLIIARTGAPVLPVLVEGTPQGPHAWSSLFHFSRSTVRFFPVVRYSGGSASEISKDLRGRYLDWTRWPANDAPRKAGASSTPGAAGGGAQQGSRP